MILKCPHCGRDCGWESRKKKYIEENCINVTCKCRKSFSVMHIGQHVYLGYTDGEKHQDRIGTHKEAIE